MSTAEADLNAAIRQLRASTNRLTLVDGEDLVQEALTRAIANGVAPDALPWLRTVTRRLAIDRARRAREIASGGSAELEQVITDTTLGPEEHVVVREDRIAVRRALATLPPRYREALIVYAEGGDAREVADRFSISTDATYTLLFRARQRLRDALERAGFVPGVAWFRLQRWQDALTAGCLAAGLAVGSAFAPAAVNPDVEAPGAQRASVVAAAAVVPPQGSATVEQAAPVPPPHTSTVVQAPSPDTTRTVTTVEVDCVDEDSGSGAFLGVRVEDGPMRSPVDHLTQVLKEDDAQEDCPT